MPPKPLFKGAKGELWTGFFTPCAAAAYSARTSVAFASSRYSDAAFATSLHNFIAALINIDGGIRSAEYQPPPARSGKL